ncbi:MAG: sugar ABC transporter ATP-binding protein [Christensenellaceae bacterium]
MNESILLDMKNINKSFPGVKALDGVHLEVKKGEIHALLGENGAGKSTLIKILGGIYKADSGEIYVNGEQINIHDVQSAAKTGVSVVHQELCLAGNLTVAENIFVGRVPVKKPFGLTDRKTMNKMARELCLKYGLDLDPETHLDKLTIAQQQMVELAKALSKDARIVVLDEPTGPLTDAEIKKLFDAVRNLKKQGVSFIYISHRMDEIFELADRATILRDGKYIATKEVSDLTYNSLVNLMIGREMSEMFVPPNATVGDVILEAKNISIGNRVKNVSLKVRKGEVLGLYGLVGSGRTELVRGICGVDKIDSGEIWIEGKKANIHKPQDSIGHGISLVPENRKEQGLILINSVAFNMTIGIWKKIITGIHIRKKYEQNVITKYVEKLAVKTPSLSTLVDNLSGGNQQKVVIAKALATEPKILIMDEPTRGIDVGAKKEIYEIMNALVNEGVAIVMISSELPELIGMSNRVAVMHEGVMTGELAEGEVTEEKIIVFATGGQTNEQ